MESFDLIDAGMKGDLVPTLRAWKDEGLSLRAMTKRLADQGFVVSHETVRRWFRDRDLTDDLAEAAS